MDRFLKSQFLCDIWVAICSFTEFQNKPNNEANFVLIFFTMNKVVTLILFSFLAFTPALFAQEPIVIKEEGARGDLDIEPEVS